MAFEFLTETYRAFLSDTDQGNADAVIAGAVHDIAEKHPSDWPRFAPAVEHLSTMVFSNHRLIPLAVYLELLYCGVKHGDFSKAWRLQLKRPSASNEQTTSSSPVKS